MIELPEKFVSRMERLLGEEFKDFLAAYDRPQSSGLHVNLHKISVEDLLKVTDIPLSPIDYTADGFTYRCDRIGSHPLHHAGAIYSQEPSAMMPISMLSCQTLPKNSRILDVCASPGVKTSQAANIIAKTDGVIISNEVIGSRCLTLAENIERLGIRNSVVTNLSASTLGELFEGVFDLVIVDAPCSGEGMFRKNPRAISEWSEENVSMCAARQWEILSEVSSTVGGGGYLLYSTCTFSEEENEQIVARFLAEHPDFAPVMPSDAVIAATADGIEQDGRDMSFCRRFYPHLAEGEGQFAALLRRVGNPAVAVPRFYFNYRSALTLPTKSDAAIVREFLRDTIGQAADDMTLCRRRDGIYAIPELPVLPVGLLSAGVKLGIVQKGRFVPHHRFFMAYGASFKNKLELSREQAERYIRGDTLPCSDFVGWGVAAYCGCTLGGIKVSGGVAKNHYPKGLRV